MDDYKVYAHVPPHLYRDNAKYFITASTYERRKILDSSAKQQLILSILKACSHYEWKLEDWVILDNHYHIMINAPQEALNLPSLIGEYHKFTALFVKKHNPQSVLLPKIFNNYWDTCITFERSYYARLNYLYQNPVKHGYVRNAQDYEWGSFFFRYQQNKEYVEKLQMEFPCDAVLVADDF